MDSLNALGSRKLLMGLLVLVSGCGGGSIDPPVQTAEEICAVAGSSTLGNGFFCASAQANLNTFSFPDRSLGFCMVAGENLGLVGYSTTTFSGGAFPVTSQATASQQSRDLGALSPGYSRCTRI